MTKTGISISIELDYLNYCKKNDINISRWVNNKMSEEFLDFEDKVNKLEKDKEAIAKKIEELKTAKEQREQRNKERIKNLTEEEEKELRDSATIIKEKGITLFKPRHNRYNNIFKDITEQEFKALIDYFLKN